MPSGMSGYEDWIVSACPVDSRNLYVWANLVLYDSFRTTWWVATVWCVACSLVVCVRTARLAVRTIY